MEEWLGVQMRKVSTGAKQTSDRGQECAVCVICEKAEGEKSKVTEKRGDGSAVGEEGDWKRQKRMKQIKRMGERGMPLGNGGNR